MRLSVTLITLAGALAAADPGAAEEPDGAGLTLSP